MVLSTATGAPASGAFGAEPEDAPEAADIVANSSCADGAEPASPADGDRWNHCPNPPFTSHSPITRPNAAAAAARKYMEVPGRRNGRRAGGGEPAPSPCGAETEDPAASAASRSSCGKMASTRL